MGLSQQPTVIDATDLILGRMASVVAKRLLMGERIVIVNAEKTVVSGKRHMVVGEYKKALEIRTLASLEKSPYRPRRPDVIVKSVVEGMLPKDNWRGRQALKRLRVYVGCPLEYKDVEKETIPQASSKRLKHGYVYLGDVAKEIGWNPR